MAQERASIFAAVLLAVISSPLFALEWQEQIVGNTMPGWEVKDHEDSAWIIADGVLTCTGNDRAKGWIGTKAMYTDCAIDFEFMVPPGGNSGVFLRTAGATHSPARDIEIQLLDDYAEKHAKLEPGQYCGSVYKFCPPSKRVSKPAGEWNHMRVTIVADDIQVIMNGEVIVDTDKGEHPEIAAKSPRGFIGFQNYGEKVQFRNVRLADIAKEREIRSRWFRDAKFGMFIHWGIYAVRGEGEWIMHVARIPAAEYEKLAPQFNPVKFDAAKWVGLARRAGQKYMVITSKHHDGFAMFETKAGPYNIVDATPYKRDPMKDLAAECAKQGMTFAFYHSILDWHHPHFLPAPDWDKKAREGYKPDPDRYIDFLQAQVREICSNYGPIAILWYDGGHREVFNGRRTRMREINAMARELQPQILINNRSVMSEDFITPEQYVPPTGLFGPDGAPLLWENCITLTTGNGSYPPTAWWGYDKNETRFKDAEYVIRMLADIVSKGGNLLLNVGPSPEGEIGPDETKTLEETGRWLEKYGESIYGTTASPFRYLPFYGRATVKGDTLYAIVFSWPKDRQITLPGVRNEVRGVRLLGEPDAKLGAERRGDGIVVSLPEKAPDAVASVVAVDLDKPPVVEPCLIQPGDDGTISLPILYADLRGRHGQHIRIETPEGEPQVGRWDNGNDYLTWEFSLPQAGKYEVNLTLAVDQASEGGTFQVIAGSLEAATTAPSGKDVMNTLSPEMINQLAAKGSVCEGKVSATGGATAFASQKVGSVGLPAGQCVLAIRPTKINKGSTLMNLRQVTLNPLDKGR